MINPPQKDTKTKQNKPNANREGNQTKRMVILNCTKTKYAQYAVYFEVPAFYINLHSALQDYSTTSVTPKMPDTP